VAITQWLPVDFVKNVGDVETDYFFGIQPNLYDYVFVVVMLRDDTGTFPSSLPIDSVGVCGEFSVTQDVYQLANYTPTDSGSGIYWIGIYSVQITTAPLPGDGVYLYWNSGVTSHQVTGHMMIFIEDQIKSTTPLDGTGTNQSSTSSTPTVTLSSAASLGTDFSIWAFMTTKDSSGTDTGINPQAKYGGANYGTIQDSTTAWGSGQLAYTVVTANSNVVFPTAQSATWNFTSATTMSWIAVAATYLKGPVNTLNISTQPVSAVITMFQAATFSVTATSDDLPITYQWQSSTDGGVTWVDILGATSSTYTTPVITTLIQANTLYRCIVTDSG
jgi:hypothetical protein